MLGTVKTKLVQLWNKGAFHILGGSFLNKFISMFASIIIVRLLTKSDYGLLSYTENIYNYAFIFAGFGLSNSILRFVVLEQDKIKKSAYFYFSVKYGIFINIIIVLFVIFLNTLIQPSIEFTTARGLLYIYILILPFQHLLDDFLMLERAMFSNTRYAYFSLIILCILLLGRIIGAYVNGVWGVIYFILFLYVLLSIGYYFNIRRTYFRKLTSITIDKSEKKKMIVYSLQYMITNGLWTIFSLNGTFLLGQLASSREIIADFKVATVLPGCLGLISGAIGTYVAPYFIQNENDRKWVWYNFKRSCFVTFIILLIFCIGGIIFGKLIVVVIYGNRYLSVIPTMNLLLISAVINGSFRYTTANIFAAMGMIKYNMIVSVIGILCQFIFSYLLVPKYNSIGTAMVEVIVYTIMSIVLIIFFIYRYRKGSE